MHFTKFNFQCSVQYINCGFQLVTFLQALSTSPCFNSKNYNFHTLYNMYSNIVSLCYVVYTSLMYNFNVTCTPIRWQITGFIYVRCIFLSVFFNTRSITAAYTIYCILQQYLYHCFLIYLLSFEISCIAVPITISEQTLTYVWVHTCFLQNIPFKTVWFKLTEKSVHIIFPNT